MFWLGLLVGIIGTLLLEFLYCALTINMTMTNRELETRYTQMKLAWKNLVNANIDLVDENKMLKEEIERLNNIINELEKTLLEWHEYWEDDDSYSWQYKNAYDYLQELKGSDK